MSPRRYRGKSAEERRAERRLALVAAGLEIWQEQGWAAVTMRGVCARAGLTDRYFYESFADRDALLSTIWDQMRDQTLEMVLAAVMVHAQDSALVQLRAAIDAVVHHIADEPTRAQIIFGDHAGSEVLENRRRDTLQLTTDLMIQMARPFLRPGVDEQAFRVTILVGLGGFTELMYAWRSGVVEADADTIIAHLYGVGTALAPPFLEAEGG